MKIVFYDIGGLKFEYILKCYVGILIYEINH